MHQFTNLTSDHVITVTLYIVPALKRVTACMISVHASVILLSTYLLHPLFKEMCDRWRDTLISGSK